MGEEIDCFARHLCCATLVTQAVDDDFFAVFHYAEDNGSAVGVGDRHSMRATVYGLSPIRIARPASARRISLSVLLVTLLWTPRLFLRTDWPLFPGRFQTVRIAERDPPASEIVGARVAIRLPLPARRDRNALFVRPRICSVTGGKSLDQLALAVADDDDFPISMVTAEVSRC